MVKQDVETTLIDRDLVDLSGRGRTITPEGRAIVAEIARNAETDTREEDAC